MHCGCSSYDVLAISGLDADWLSKAYCERILEIESGSSVNKEKWYLRLWNRPT
ncbi:uncharacterized protein STEHIDRAFT_145964 [Stereum hirsutum FP-91666 SS1]|uniref:uncharacterized protein n=1 Tax=Stereum hirsutum (strain FP-91666) TaxID=721885 RepID=UPI000440DD0C|nr:uncharacterized protein STEHIDRAFT_145964 [Stereum hirsutum FP-91666 SS1]EIM89347.1 hypothetical protein STEHIDRAFT_145964 [Stereum hirsutum FP-91666 SS1]